MEKNQLTLKKMCFTPCVQNIHVLCFCHGNDHQIPRQEVQRRRHLLYKGVDRVEPQRQSVCTIVETVQGMELGSA